LIRAERLGLRRLDAAFLRDLLVASGMKGKAASSRRLSSRSSRRIKHERKGGVKPPHSKVPSARAPQVFILPR
jgi:hypothetical protein